MFQPGFHLYPKIYAPPPTSSSGDSRSAEGAKTLDGRKWKNSVYEKVMQASTSTEKPGENRNTADPRAEYKRKIGDIRNRAGNPEEARQAGEDYEKIIQTGGLYGHSEEMLKEQFGIDLESLVNNEFGKSNNENQNQPSIENKQIIEFLSSSTSQIKSKVGSLRNMSNFLSRVITILHRVMNNVLSFDQIRAGNIPFKLGTLKIEKNGKIKEVINIRHGSPLIEEPSLSRKPEVTPEFKAFVNKLGKEEPLLYLNRMKTSEGDEIKKSAALKDFAEKTEGKMVYVALPVDGTFIQQKGSYETDKNFNTLSEEVVNMIENNEGGFHLDDATKLKLYNEITGKNETKLNNNDFKKAIKEFFENESKHYNKDLVSKDSLTRDERRALLINFVNGPLTEKIIQAADPQYYINSCKENVDRGSVGNAIHAFRNCTSGDDDESQVKLKTRIKESFLVLVTPVLLAKKRMVNHNLTNMELFLQYASKDYLKNPHKEGSPELTFEVSRTS